MSAPDRKRRLTAFVVAMAVLIATPLAVVAADAFTDVPNTNVFHDDIAWLADAGVTKGCNPPDNTEFCPSDNVTREQMAAFMRRLAQYIDAEDGTPAHADHATTAGSADSATTADTAAAAGDSDTLDGLDSSEFVGTKGGVELFAAAYVGGTTIQDSVGPVALAENLATGEYRITFSEDLFPTGSEYAFINVTAVNIFGNTCAWSFNGSATDQIDVSCRTAAGADANSSFTFTVYRATAPAAAGGSGDAGADSGR